MQIHRVKKVVIITEKLIAEKVCEIIDTSGASGYTITHVGGKGSRNVRTNAEKASVVGDFSNVKIEVIVKDQAAAEKITAAVVDQFFQNFSGITFIEDVEVLRMSKFTVE